MQLASPIKSTAATQQGSSLIELLLGISVAILLVGSALTGVASHQTQRRMHGERTLAMCACRNTLEQLRSVDISALPSYDGQSFDVPGQNGETRGLTCQPGDADGFAGEISVTAHPRSQAGNELYVVRTTARWRGATRGGTLTLQTLMGERR